MSEQTKIERNEQPWICDECGMAHAVLGQICMTPNCRCETRHLARDDEVPIEWSSDLRVRQFPKI
jgi:ribosomal protein S14